MSGKPKFHIRVIGLLVVLTLVLVCAAVGEWALRGSEPKRFVRPSQVPGLSYELIPNYHAVYSGIDYRINQLGFRGEDFPQVKPPGEHRILFLGDSIVQGGHVREEEAVGAQLQALWNSRPGAPATRVINAGVSSYHIKNYLAVYEYRGVQLSPDTVLIGVFLNDHFPFIDEDKLKTVERKPAVWERSQLLLAIVAGVRNLLLSKAVDLNTADPRVVQGLLSAIPDQGSVESLFRFLNERGYSLDVLAQESIPLVFDLTAWDQIRGPLKEFVRLLKGTPVKLMVVVFPVEFQLQEGYTYPEPQRRIREICESLKIPVLDTVPVLTALQHQLGHSVYHRKGDLMHFNAEAHRAVAEAIYQYQQELAVAQGVGSGAW